MSDSTADNRHEPDISFNGDGTEVPLWLLQKDESRFLYFSFLLSITVHIVVFLVMAATRIFHPFAGATHQFDLVWLSPAPATAPMQAAASKPPAPAKAKKHVTAQASAKTMQSPPTPAAKAKPKPPPAAKKSSPPSKAPATPAVTPPKPLTTEAPVEEPAEMVIPRYGGKVVDIVEHKEDIPTFTVISSVKMKSTTARAVVHTIKITDTKPSKPRETKEETKPAEKEASVSPPKETVPAKPEKPARVASAQKSSPGTEAGKSDEKALPIQGSTTSATKTVAPKQTAAATQVNRSINSFAAALGALNSTAGKLSTMAQATPAHGTAAAGSEKSAALDKSGSKTNGADKSSATLAPAGKSQTEAPTQVAPSEPKKAEKPAPQEPEKPKLVLHPPLVGDLKLVMTTDADLKVEAFFKQYPKSRRSKPLTRWESKNRQGVVPKMIRTGEKVHEAVVEITQEGIYTILVSAGSGKQAKATFVLKIRESRPKAVTKDLGSRTISGTVEVVRVLMPEGILWDDDSYFTGNMEDSDSITKFHSGTGLMWREYK